MKMLASLLSAFDEASIVQSHLPMTELFSQLLTRVNFTDISRFGGLSRVIDEMAEALGDREKVLYWLYG